VEEAIRNLFPTLTTTHEPKRSLLTAQREDLDSLDTLRAKITQQRIRASIQEALRRRIQGETLRFSLNKQAAYMGKVSLCLEGEDPLGPIKVYIIGDPLGAINHLCS